MVTLTPSRGTVPEPAIPALTISAATGDRRLLGVSPQTPTPLPALTAAQLIAAQPSLNAAQVQTLLADSTAHGGNYTYTEPPRQTVWAATPEQTAALLLQSKPGKPSATPTLPSEKETVPASMPDWLAKLLGNTDATGAAKLTDSGGLIEEPTTSTSAEAIDWKQIAPIAGVAIAVIALLFFLKRK